MFNKGEVSAETKSISVATSKINRFTIRHNVGGGALLLAGAFAIASASESFQLHLHLLGTMGLAYIGYIFLKGV